MASFNKEGYSYAPTSNWMSSSSTPSGILTSGTQFSSTITSNVTLYAIYTAKQLTYTVKFMTFNGTSYQNVGSYNNVTWSESLSSLSTFLSSITVKDIVIGGTKYSFFGWADVSSSTTILEDYKQAKVDENTQIKSNKTFCAIYKGDYLAFTAVENTKIYFAIFGTLVKPISLQYRTESDKQFKDYTWGGSKSATSGDGLNISLNVGDKIYFKGSNATFSSDDKNYVFIKSTGKIKASGSVMSLLNVRDTIPCDYCFYNLFHGCTYSLLTPPELPVTTLKDNCYRAMFNQCHSLNIDNPKEYILPATKLEKSCYYMMFQYCTSLKNSPNIKAEVLAESAFTYMFCYCSQLSKIIIKAPYTSSNDYWIWHNGVSSSGTIYCDWIDAPRNNYGIPTGWNVLPYSSF